MISRPSATTACTFLIAILFSACSPVKDDDKTMQVLSEGLDQASLTISRESVHTCMQLQQKLTDPASRERASIWFPLAERIHQLSDKTVSYIDSVKFMVKKTGHPEKEKLQEVYRRLKKYRSDLFSIDPVFSQTFTKTLVLTTPGFDSLDPGTQDFSLYFFDHTAPASTLALLSRFVNNIRVAELRLIAFCNEQVGKIVDYFTLISAIVGQNSRQLIAGEKIEIQAGIGYFSGRNDPQIIINGIKTVLNNEGMAIYKQTVPSIPGKYSIPVTIHYTDENSKRQSLYTRVSYTVVDNLH
ncbi:MAG: hypothetical protein ABW019_14855 [Chitinophagaceae bacterium]